jgi:hypothetical protein
MMLNIQINYKHIHNMNIYERIFTENLKKYPHE